MESLVHAALVMIVSCIVAIVYIIYCLGKDRIVLIDEPLDIKRIELFLALEEAQKKRIEKLMRVIEKGANNGDS